MKANGARVLTWIAALVAVGMLTAGCGDPPEEPGKAGGSFSVAEVQLDDGRKVTCVTWKDGFAGGLACDWDSAQEVDQ